MAGIAKVVVEIALGYGPGAQKQRVGQAALAVVNVRDNTEISDKLLIHPRDCTDLPAFNKCLAGAATMLRQNVNCSIENQTRP